MTIVREDDPLLSLLHTTAMPDVGIIAININPATIRGSGVIIFRIKYNNKGSIIKRKIIALIMSFYVSRKLKISVKLVLIIIGYTIKKDAIKAYFLRNRMGVCQR